MPFRLKAAPNGFFVENKATGRKYSNMPLPKSRAVKQMRALYARMPGEARALPEGHTKMPRHVDSDRRK